MAVSVSVSRSPHQHNWIFTLDSSGVSSYDCVCGGRITSVGAEAELGHPYPFTEDEITWVHDYLYSAKKPPPPTPHPAHVPVNCVSHVWVNDLFGRVCCSKCNIFQVQPPNTARPPVTAPPEECRHQWPEYDCVVGFAQCRECGVKVTNDEFFAVGARVGEKFSPFLFRQIVANRKPVPATSAADCRCPSLLNGHYDGCAYRK